MLACLDVYYQENEACAACLLFHDWTDERPADERLLRTPIAGEYAPGRFYERELPSLLAVLRTIDVPLEAVIIDGYVWLGADGEPGLGARLYEALERRVPVIGVAKSAFRGSDFAVPVRRGDSDRPLFVTAAGVDAGTAAGLVRGMHGPFRVPTLLRLVDQRSRIVAPP